MKYVQVEGTWKWISPRARDPLRKLGYEMGLANDSWVLYYENKLIYETTDHVLFDNYLKLLLED